MEIIYDYPSWFLILCIAGGLIAGAVLYLRDRLNRHFGDLLRYTLFLMRAVVVSILAFFLLKPLIKTSEREVEKPIIVIAQDNSESLIVDGDSSAFFNDYMGSLAQMRLSLEENYDVRTLSFGEKVTEGWDNIDLTDQTTNFSDLMDEVYNRFSNRNLGAVIVASDGIYNTGLNPQYAARKLEAPIYAIALGDTTPQKDVLIAHVSNNRLAYLGNLFPMDIRVDAHGMESRKTTLKITHKGETVHSEAISFNDTEHSSVVSVLLDADKSGLQKYVVSIGALDGEITASNNVRSVFIDVLDSRQKVLLLAASPHPDLAALKLAIDKNDLYESETMLIKDFDGKVDEYNLVILHQLPSVSDASSTVMRALAEKEIPTLFILGGGTNFNDFNDLSLGISVKGFSGTLTEINSSFAEGFTLFMVDDELQQLVKKFPPLHIPFGNINYSPGMTTMLQQRAGILDTGDPLLTFNQQNNRKIGVLLGEGIWRWRLFTYLEKQSHDPFDRMISKVVQFLASQDDKSRFRIDTETDWLENQSVSFESEVYNLSYELVQDVEVSMSIKDEEGKQFNFQFSPLGDGFKLDAGSFPSGNYTFTATTEVGGESLSERGEFSVSEIQLEQVKTRANHRMLFNFAEASGGRMITPTELDSLPNIIFNSGKVQSISHETRILSDFINTKWILYLLLGFLAIEWLLRKRNGTY
ncbi:MAG: hypothetical protein ACJAV7_002998 [Flavobacteriales bacterium]